MENVASKFVGHDSQLLTKTHHFVTLSMIMEDALIFILDKEEDFDIVP